MKFTPAHDIASPPSDFHVADLGPAGDLRSIEPYSYKLLEQIPGATELISTISAHLYRTPDEFDTVFGVPPTLRLRFIAPAPTAGIATLRNQSDGLLVSLSILLSGIDPTSDAITLDALQKHLLRELRDTPHEPSFALMSLEKRPLVATMAFGESLQGVASHVAALADRCMGAAFFRYLRIC